MDLGLKGLRALVTASSQGLGAATATQLALDGARVALNGRDPAKLAQTESYLRQSTGADLVALAGDVSRPEDAQRLVEDSVRAFGGLDILVTNSGGPKAGNFEDLTPADWQAAFDLLVMSTVNLIQAALPHLRQSSYPSILVVTSLAIKQPVKGLLLSNAVRMSLAGLVKTLADELGPQNIRINAILPGWTLTDRMTYLLGEQAKSTGQSVQDLVNARAAHIPLRRMGQPEEFGKMAAFLCSPAASFVHGAMIPVDGGELRATL